MKEVVCAVLKTTDVLSVTAIPLYENVTGAAYTLDANDYLHVTDVFLSADAATVFSIFADGDVAGERFLVSVPTDAGSAFSVSLEIPFVCQRGVGLTATAAGGAAKFIRIQGFISGA